MIAFRIRIRSSVRGLCRAQSLSWNAAKSFWQRLLRPERVNSRYRCLQGAHSTGMLCSESHRGMLMMGVTRLRIGPTEGCVGNLAVGTFRPLDLSSCVEQKSMVACSSSPAENWLALRCEQRWARPNSPFDGAGRMRF